MLMPFPARLGNRLPPAFIGDLAGYRPRGGAGGGGKVWIRFRGAEGSVGSGGLSGASGGGLIL